MKISGLAKNKHYKKQHKFYREAYEEGNAQWTGDGSPSSELVKTIKEIKSGLKLKRALDLGSGEGKHRHADRKKYAPWEYTLWIFKKNLIFKK